MLPRFEVESEESESEPESDSESEFSSLFAAAASFFFFLSFFGYSLKYFLSIISIMYIMVNYIEFYHLIGYFGLLVEFLQLFFASLLVRIVS
jgi:hypothetical protein